MSSNELTGSPSSSVWFDVGTTVSSASSPSGTADSVALGAQAANSAEPVMMPAALRKSRRERYCEYGVISDDLTGTDLNFVLMITSYSGCHCEEGVLPDEAIPQSLGDCFVANGAPRNDMANMSLPTMP